MNPGFKMQAKRDSGLLLRNLCVCQTHVDALCITNCPLNLRASQKETNACAVVKLLAVYNFAFVVNNVPVFFTITHFQIFSASAMCLKEVRV